MPRSAATQDVRKNGSLCDRWDDPLGEGFEGEEWHVTWPGVWLRSVGADVTVKGGVQTR